MITLTAMIATRLAFAAILACTVVGCAFNQPEQASSAAAAASSRKETEPMQSPSTPNSVPKGKEVATLAGGCFWCTEAIFQELKGVEKVEPGYSGGQVANPTYEQVCTGRTGHAESIQITFDPRVISFADILRVFMTTHDPTTLNRQGADVGTQYRSAVFTHSDAQKKTARAVVAEIEGTHVWPGRIVTEVTPFTSFYPAEEYHREYYQRNQSQPYCRIVIAPKVAKLREKYRRLLKQQD